jgi:hypothetical protein
VEADKMDLFSFALLGILATLGAAEGNVTQCFPKLQYVTRPSMVLQW